MGRVRKDIEVGGRSCSTLFDTGSRNTYLTPKVASLLQVIDLPREYQVGLGGQVRTFKQACILIGQVEGHDVNTEARVVDEIGADEDGRPIDILFGALAMQQWGIHPVPEEERLDLTHYTKEFIEY